MELQILHWNTFKKKKDLEEAFRRSSSWVIDTPRNPPQYYFAVLSNLSCRYIAEEHQTISGVAEALNAGLERKSFDRLKEISGVSGEQLGKAIGIPMRTLARREKFTMDESERILRVASVFQKTIELFDDLGKARHWFTTPHRALGGKTPLEFCSTGIGADEVECLLGRIEHGVFS